MDKRSQKRSLLACEMHPSGCTCVWEAYSKPLPQDLKPSNRQCFGQGNAGFTNSMLNDFAKTNRTISDKTDIKDRRKILMEGNILSVQKTNRVRVSKVDSMLKKHEMLSQTYPASVYPVCRGYKHAAYMRQQQQLHCSDFDDKSLNKLNSNDSTKKVCNQLHPVSDREHIVKGTRSDVCLQGQTNEAADVFVNQKLNNSKFTSKDGSQKKHILDALQIVDSNKELFTKLLQDPNSVLVKHIQGLKGAQAGRDHNKPTSEETSSDHHTDRPSHLKESIYTRTVKSPDRYRAKETGNSYLSDQIVILKPDLSSTRNFDDMTRDAHFSFKSIKRKLGKAIKLRKKKAQRLSTQSAVHRSSNYQGLDSCHGSVKETIGQITPYELIAAVGVAESCIGVDKKYNTVWSKDCKLIDARDSVEKYYNSSSHSKHGDKKLGSMKGVGYPWMFDDTYNEEDISKRRDSRTTISPTSLGAYELFPTFRSGREWEHHLVTMRTRFPYSRNFQMANEASYCPQKEKSSYLNRLPDDVRWMYLSDKYRPKCPSKALYALPNQLENMFSNVEVNNDNCSNLYASSDVSMSSLKENEKSDLETKSHMRFPHERTRRIDTTSSSQSTSTTNTCNDDVLSESSELDLIVENKPSLSSSVVYSPSRLTTDRIDTNLVKAQNLNKDGAEQPSPLSVPDQYFTANEINHRTTSPPVEAVAVAPKQITEQCAYAALVKSCHDLKNLIVSAEEHCSSSTFKLVKGVLHYSKLNWNEILRRCQASEKFLDPSLFKETCPSELTTEQRLLFDFINEVLLQIYHCHIRSYPWLAFFAHNICPFSMEKDLAPEVIKCIDGHLQQQPQTLDSLFANDLNTSAKWIDIRADAEDIFIEIAGSILEELIRETIFS